MATWENKSKLDVTVVSSVKELDQILDLQRQNHPEKIDPEEMLSQGFVTVHHTREVLQIMHDLSPSVIVKDNGNVVAYALVMLNTTRHMIPELQPMFEIFDHLEWKKKSLNDYRYYVMGQVCISKKYRGQGLFEMLYEEHRSRHANNFDFIITEVSKRNVRSMRAHERIGFITIHTHIDELDEWNIMIWDWNDKPK